MLAHQSNTELLNRLHQAVRLERDSTLRVIELLEQVESRKLYLRLGFASLIEFCTQELKYSESAAYRRISAMRAVGELPQLESKIEAGELSLAVVAQAQSHIRQTEKTIPMSCEEKLTLFESLSGLSSRQAEKELLYHYPKVFLKKETLRQITPELQKLTLILDEEMQKDLEKLKNILSHQIPGASWTEVLKFAVKGLLKKKDLAMSTKASTPSRQAAVKQSAAAPALAAKAVARKTLPTKQLSTDTCAAAPALAPRPVASKASAKNVALGANVKFAKKPSGQTRMFLRIGLPITIKREVWRKHLGQCCFQHQGKKCSSRFQLEIDHILPISRGGTNDIDNLQLLCRAHNQLKGSTISQREIYA